MLFGRKSETMKTSEATPGDLQAARFEGRRDSKIINIIFVGESVSSGVRLFTVPHASACTQGH